MHGLIFRSLREYAFEVHGIAPYPGSVYLLSEAYPDEDFEELVGQACAATGMERSALLRDFGNFTAGQTFARLFPMLFAETQSTKEFLLGVDQNIHRVVRAVMPNALPPSLAVHELDANGVLIAYTSRRRLCELLCGLVEGTARHYGESVSIVERTCMHREDPACTIEVRVGQGASG